MLLAVDLVGLADLVQLLGVSRARVEQFVKEPDFPKAHRVGAQRVRVWDLDEVEEWARSRSKPREIHRDALQPGDQAED